MGRRGVCVPIVACRSGGGFGCFGRSGVAGRGRERGFELSHFGALLVELGLMGEGVPQPRLEARQPAGDFRNGAAFLGELDFEPAQSRFEARDEAERGHILFAGDWVGPARAPKLQFEFVEASGPRLDRKAADRADVRGRSRFLRLELSGERNQRLARGLALGQLAVADRHHEGVAPYRRPPREVLRDLGDPLRRVGEALLAVADLAADRELVVEMAVAQRTRRAISDAIPALRMRRSSPDAIALASANWFACEPASSMRRTERSPAMAASMKRALRSRICHPVASTLRFVA